MVAPDDVLKVYEGGDPRTTWRAVGDDRRSGADDGPRRSEIHALFTLISAAVQAHSYRLGREPSRKPWPTEMENQCQQSQPSDACPGRPISSRSDRRSDWQSWSWDSRQIWSPTWTRLSITTTEAMTGPQLSAHLVVFVGMALVLIGVVVDGVRSGRRSGGTRNSREVTSMPFGDFINQIPALGFLAIHATAFLIGAYFAWRSFGAGASAARLGLQPVRAGRAQLHDLPPRLDGLPVRPHGQ